MSAQASKNVGGPRRGGFFPGMLLNVLKWAAIGIGPIIIVVTTTVVTVQRPEQGQLISRASPPFPRPTQCKQQPLAYYDNIEQIRGQTADETPASS